MRGTQVLSFGLGAALLCLTGCWETEANLRPPKQPEEYRLPPEDDARFSSPPSYPKGTLNQDYIKKDKEREENNKPGFPSSHGGGPGVSGAGGGY
jgi:hypothetical protein